MFCAGRRALLLAVALTSLLGLSPRLFADDVQTVYFTGPDNRISKVLDFAAGTSQVVVTDKGTNFKSLVVRDDGADGLKLIAANHTSRGDLRIYDLAGNKGIITPLCEANAVALDTSGNLFAVDEDSTLVMVPRVGSCPNVVSGTFPAGCHPGGYGDPIVIDKDVDGAKVIEDVKVVSSAGGGAPYKVGDVLVLVEYPAKLLRYKKEDVAAKRANPDYSFTPTVLLPTATAGFGGTHPDGFVFAPNGEILIATDEGRILRFAPGGGTLTAVPTDFASVSGNLEKIAVGLQSGVPEVLATVHTGGSVRRFSIQADGTGLADGSVYANSPDGVGNASLTGSVYVGKSDTPVATAPNSSDQLTFEKVVAPGMAKARVLLCKDLTWNSGVDRRLNNAAQLDCGGPTGLPDRKIPGYIKAFDRDGTPTFLLYVVDSSVGIFGATLEHHIEENDFGFNTACTDSNNPAAQQPRTFYATDADDAPIIEGTSFAEISSGCGSNFGRGGGTSLILTAWDTRSVNDRHDCNNIAGSKLSILRTALNSTNVCAGGLSPFFTSSSIRKSLDALLKKAIGAFDCGNNAGAIGYLQTFINQIKASPAGTFKECASCSTSCRTSGQVCRNTPGELIARAESAIFIVCGAKSPECNRTLIP